MTEFLTTLTTFRIYVHYLQFSKSKFAILCDAMAATVRSKELPAWYKEMEKDLECPVCLNNFLDPPIYVCVNMHELCFTCHKKLTDQVSFEVKNTI